MLNCVVGLSFELRSGTNILVTGDSGCGKSSLLRVLDGLWSHSEGVFGFFFTNISLFFLEISSACFLSVSIVMLVWHYSCHLVVNTI